MAQGSDSNDTSYKSPSPGSRASSSDDMKKVMRREKNRIAAQRSRMKQTLKADSLHMSSSDDMKKVMRREKNRIAAQRSRMKQTLKADSLHMESENLEKENEALRKEVKQLTEEAKCLSSVLSNHEPLCTGLNPQTPDLLYPAHHSNYHHQHISLPHYQH